MLAKLFRRLTNDSQGRADALFDGITAIARRPHWYVEGGLPDDIDGRFAVLATITALVILRFEQGGEVGNPLSAALTGRFAEVMDSEHRELGVGEPTLGKTVLRLVGSLERRVDLWRSAKRDSASWVDAAKNSLPLAAASDAQARHCADSIAALKQTLDRCGLPQLATGNIE